MKVFLIILAVLFVLTVAILSLSAEFTVIFDNGWTTKIRVLFIERDIQLTKLLSFLVAPDKAGQEAAEKTAEKKKHKGKDKDKPVEPAAAAEAESAGETAIEITDTETSPSEAQSKTDDKPKKKNPIMTIYDEEGIVGIMSLVTNLLQTVNTAVTTLIKGLHIYSLYVKMIIGGGDAADIGEKYGSICGWYYPLKGYILNQMRVDQYDDYIMPDFIAPRSEYEFQFIGSISVGLLAKTGLSAVKVFLSNYLSNKFSKNK